MQDLNRLPAGGREGLAQIACLHSGQANGARAGDVTGPANGATAVETARTHVSTNYTGTTTRPTRAAQVAEVSGCASPYRLSRPIRPCPFTSNCHGSAPSSHL